MKQIDTRTYLYLIAHYIDDCFVSPIKAGVSSSPRRRLKTLQTGNPLPLRIVFAFCFPNADLALVSEQDFHVIERKHRLHGEWFNIDPFDALELMCTYVGVRVAYEVGDTVHYSKVVEAVGINDALNALSRCRHG